MGCGMSTEEKEGKQRNEEIENQLKKDRMMQRNEIKMLLLGSYHSVILLRFHTIANTSWQEPESLVNPPF